MSDNGGHKPCNCSNSTVPNDTEADKLNKMFHETQLCFSNQKPPLMGKKDDICAGNKPRTHEDLRRETDDTVDRWTVYLVVAIFVTMILTAIVTWLVIKFCCSGEKDPTVSPRD